MVAAAVVLLSLGTTAPASADSTTASVTVEGGFVSGAAPPAPAESEHGGTSTVRNVVIVGLLGLALVNASFAWRYRRRPAHPSETGPAVVTAPVS